jgi:hypothetical protein
MAITAASHGVGALIGRVALASACAFGWPACARLAVANDELPSEGAMNGARAAADIHTPMEFDIHPQPLQGALEQFSAATGQSGISDAAVSMSISKPSNGARGTMAPDEALRRLTQGTGLSARYVSGGTFVVVPDPQPIAPSPAVDGNEAPQARMRYYAQVQSGIRDAFCRNPVALPPEGRLAFSLWLDSAGNVKEVNLLDGTGSAAGDVRLAGGMRGMHIAGPAPAGIRQPITMVIRPGVDAKGLCHD